MFEYVNDQCQWNFHYDYEKHVDYNTHYKLNNDGTVSIMYVVYQTPGKNTKIAKEIFKYLAYISPPTMKRASRDDKIHLCDICRECNIIYDDGVYGLKYWDENYYNMDDMCFYICSCHKYDKFNHTGNVVYNDICLTTVLKKENRLFFMYHNKILLDDVPRYLNNCWDEPCKYCEKYSIHFNTYTYGKTDYIKYISCSCQENIFHLKRLYIIKLLITQFP